MSYPQGCCSSLGASEGRPGQSLQCAVMLWSKLYRVPALLGSIMTCSHIHGVHVDFCSRPVIPASKVVSLYCHVREHCHVMSCCPMKASPPWRPPPHLIPGFLVCFPFSPLPPFARARTNLLCPKCNIHPPISCAALSPPSGSAPWAVVPSVTLGTHVIVAAQCGGAARS